MPHAPRHPLVLTLGGGGGYAFGFSMGVAKGLADAGIDVTRAPIVGTSGGSHAAVALGAGMSIDDVAPGWEDYVDGVGLFWVDASALTEPLYGSAQVTSEVASVAIAVPRFRRELLWAETHRPADMVAASSSPFPFVRPHKVGRQRYIDGGHRSAFSADRVPAADVQLLIAPFSHKSQGLLGRMGARQARREAAKWTATTGGVVVTVGPTPEMCAVPVKGMRGLGDMGIGRQIFDLAVPLGRGLAADLRRDHPDVLAALASEPDTP